MRARAAELVGDEPWGREQWERLAEGSLFDGMESWLPWLVRTRRRCITDVLPDTAQGACWSSRGACATGPTTCSPRRTTSPARSGQHLGPRRRAPFPRLHAETDRLLAAGQADLDDQRAPASPRRTDGLGQRLGARWWATARASPTRLRELLADGYRVVVAADGDGSAERLAALLRDHGLEFRLGQRRRPT